MEKSIKMDLSIIITSFNTKDLLVSCINSIKKNTRNISYEIIVVDNASDDDSVKASKTLGAKVIENKINLGFSKGNNIGIKNSRGKYILFLNSDTLINDNVIGEMVNYMDEHLKIGVVTPMLKNMDGSIQGTGGYFPTLLTVFSWMTIQDIPYIDSIIKPFHPLHSKSFFSRGEDFYKVEKQLDWVTGAFLMTRKSILDEVGGWDESYFMYVEEVDLCFKIKKLGYQVWYLPKWNITHFGGGSSKTNELSLINEYQGVKKFYKKNYSAWKYPFLRLILKIGALGRIILFGILEGRDTAKIYANAFKIA